MFGVRFGGNQIKTMRTYATATPRWEISSINGITWVLPPLSNSWIIIIVWLYIALNRTLNIDCYWVAAVPNINPKP